MIGYSASILDPIVFDWLSGPAGAGSQEELLPITRTAVDNTKYAHYAKTRKYLPWQRALLPDHKNRLNISPIKKKAKQNNKLKKRKTEKTVTKKIYNKKKFM